MDRVLELESKRTGSNSPRFTNRSCKIAGVVFVIILVVAGAAIAYRLLDQPKGEKNILFIIKFRNIFV